MLDTAKYLEDIYQKFHKPEYIGTDPIQFVHRYSDPREMEIVALLASVLAYGRVDMINRSISNLISIYADGFFNLIFDTSYDEKCSVLADFRHRFTDGYDIALLLEVLKRHIESGSSLEGLYLAGGDTAFNRVESLAFSLREIANDIDTPKRGFKYLLPLPSGGSGCKRLNMFLRWMVRPSDGIDLGLWSKSNPSGLIIPVDVHVGRAALKLNLTKLKNPSWKQAEEITLSLSQYSPSDPLKYDFALCHCGMEEGR